MRSVNDIERSYRAKVALAHKTVKGISLLLYVLITCPLGYFFMYMNSGTTLAVFFAVFCVIISGAVHRFGIFCVDFLKTIFAIQREGELLRLEMEKIVNINKEKNNVD